MAIPGDAIGYNYSTPTYNDQDVANTITDGRNAIFVFQRFDLGEDVRDITRVHCDGMSYESKLRLDAARNKLACEIHSAKARIDNISRMADSIIENDINHIETRQAAEAAQHFVNDSIRAEVGPRHVFANYALEVFFRRFYDDHHGVNKYNVWLASSDKADVNSFVNDMINALYNHGDEDELVDSDGKQLYVYEDIAKYVHMYVRLMLHNLFFKRFELLAKYKR